MTVFVCLKQWDVIANYSQSIHVFSFKHPKASNEILCSAELCCAMDSSFLFVFRIRVTCTVSPHLQCRLYIDDLS